MAENVNTDIIPTQNKKIETFQTFSPMATDELYIPSLNSLLTMAIQNYFPFLQSEPPVPYDEEAFPDADELFGKAFGLSDPTPELLRLIKLSRLIPQRLPLETF